MTWQRIDENTYIDDTLVTCAEYQLFIDEMREQGKYYQPDHWTSYQHPVGQAREPIRGVRQTDAEAFCEWVTQRKGERYKYHLPSTEEANRFPINPIDNKTLGYWLEDKYQLMWIGSTPENARSLDTQIDTYGDAAIFLASSMARNRPIDLSLLSIEHSELSNALDHARDRSNMDIHRFELVGSLCLKYASELSDAFPDLEPYSLFNRVFHPDRYSARTEKYTRYSNLRLSRDGLLNLYMDIFTLQERIAGRSPAFEGIRLVKERIK